MIQPSWIIIAIIVGLLVATGIMRASLKSVGKQYSADFYEKEQGLTLTKNKDIYLYRKVDRIPKPKEQPRQNNAARR